MEQYLKCAHSYFLMCVSVRVCAHFSKSECIFFFFSFVYAWLKFGGGGGVRLWFPAWSSCSPQSCSAYPSLLWVKPCFTSKIFWSSSSHGQLYTTETPPPHTHTYYSPITFTTDWAEPDIARWLLHNVLMKPRCSCFQCNRQLPPRDILQPCSESQLPKPSEETRGCVAD